MWLRTDLSSTVHSAYETFHFQLPLVSFPERNLNPKAACMKKHEEETPFSIGSSSFTTEGGNPVITDMVSCTLGLASTSSGTNHTSTAVAMAAGVGAIVSSHMSMPTSTTALAEDPILYSHSSPLSRGVDTPPLSTGNVEDLTPNPTVTAVKSEPRGRSSPLVVVADKIPRKADPPMKRRSGSSLAGRMSPSLTQQKGRDLVYQENMGFLDTSSNL